VNYKKYFVEKDITKIILKTMLLEKEITLLGEKLNKRR